MNIKQTIEAIKSLPAGAALYCEKDHQYIDLTTDDLHEVGQRVLALEDAATKAIQLIADSNPPNECIEAMGVLMRSLSARNKPDAGG